MFRDEEKGKKMWSKYLEREDSKVVGKSKSRQINVNQCFGMKSNVYRITGNICFACCVYIKLDFSENKERFFSF